MFLMTESHSLICSRYPVVLRHTATPYLIAIKPEHLLEPLAERLEVGGMSLTLSVIQIQACKAGVFNRPILASS